MISTLIQIQSILHKGLIKYVSFPGVYSMPLEKSMPFFGQTLGFWLYTLTGPRLKLEHFDGAQEHALKAMESFRKVGSRWREVMEFLSRASGMRKATSITEIVWGTCFRTSQSSWSSEFSHMVGIASCYSLGPVLLKIHHFIWRECLSLGRHTEVVVFFEERWWLGDDMVQSVTTWWSILVLYYPRSVQSRALG